MLPNTDTGNERDYDRISIQLDVLYLGNPLHRSMSRGSRRDSWARSIRIRLGGHILVQKSHGVKTLALK